MNGERTEIGTVIIAKTRFEKGAFFHKNILYDFENVLKIAFCVNYVRILRCECS